MRTTAIRLAAVLTLLGGLVAGCSSSGDHSTAAGSTTLTYWAANMSATPALDEKVLRPELAKFTAQTGIKVDLQVQTWPTLYSKILTAIAGGTLPDVLDTGTTWAAALQATGAFLPLDAAALKSVGGASRFLSTSMSSTGAAGQLPAAIPVYGQSYGLYYNKAMFAAAGITAPPTTWSDFVADAKKLTKPGQWGLAVPGAFSLQNTHMAFILGRQNGAQLFDSAGRPQFDTPAEQAAVGRYLDLMTVDKVVDPDSAEQNGTEALAAFDSGKAAMMLSQTSARPALAAAKFTDYGVAQVPTLQPTPAGGAPVETMVAGSNLMLAKGGDTAAALKFTAFMTSDAEQVALDTALGTLPVVNDLQTNSAFTDDPATATFSTILAKHAETMPMLATEGTMETLVGDAVTGLWAKAANGSLTAADISSALSAANQKMAAGGS